MLFKTIYIIFFAQIVLFQNNREANPRDRKANVSLRNSELAQYEPPVYPEESVVLILEYADVARDAALDKRLRELGLIEHM